MRLNGVLGELAMSREERPDARAFSHTRLDHRGLARGHTRPNSRTHARTHALGSDLTYHRRTHKSCLGREEEEEEEAQKLYLIRNAETEAFYNPNPKTPKP